MILVLAIDPGSRVTGYGIVRIEEGSPTYVASGCIETTGPDFPSRLKDIFQGIDELINRYRPDEFAIEEVFVARNPMSALKLGQARGAAIAAAVADGALPSDPAGATPHRHGRWPQRSDAAAAAWRDRHGRRVG